MPSAVSMDGLTERLASFVTAARLRDLPEAVRAAGVRTLVNWMGVAVGAARHDAVYAACAAVAPFAGPGQATLLGRRERLDAINAAFINGIAGHVCDFDDTHPATLIHPSATVLPAALAAAEYRACSGELLLTGVILGVETACRAGLAIMPAAYESGWHMTGAAGVFGAAAAAGRILGLSSAQMTRALGFAAAQPTGMREALGSPGKAFNAGRAAAAGVQAAVLAAQDFQISPRMIEAPQGWARVMSAAPNLAAITDGLGTRFEILANTYKPYPCGLVLHPIMDAALAVRAQGPLPADDIANVRVKVHPLALELADRPAPTDSLTAKLSVQHAAAVTLVEGAGGAAQFASGALQDALVQAVRRRVVATADPGLARDQAEMTVELSDGRHITARIDHARGSQARPLSDDEIDAKFLTAAAEVLAPAPAAALLALCRKVETVLDAGALPRATMPG
jgi:2-methylcitrate dehydratase PrpD